MSATLGALVIAIATEFSVLLSARYHEERRRGGTIGEALRRAYARTGTAVLASGVTAIAGFAVLVFTDIRMLRDFGLVTVFDLGGGAGRRAPGAAGRPGLVGGRLRAAGGAGGAPAPPWAPGAPPMPAEAQAGLGPGQALLDLRRGRLPDPDRRRHREHDPHPGRRDPRHQHGRARHAAARVRRPERATRARWTRTRTSPRTTARPRRIPAPPTPARPPACEIPRQGAIRVCDLLRPPPGALVLVHEGRRTACPTQDVVDRVAARYRGRVNFLSIDVRDDPADGAPDRRRARLDDAGRL